MSKFYLNTSTNLVSCLKYKFINNLIIHGFLDYDKECCKKQCPCAKDNDNKSSETSNEDNNFNLFMKLFKPEDSPELQTQKVEASPELSNEKKAEAEGLIVEFINRLQAIIA